MRAPNAAKVAVFASALCSVMSGITSADDQTCKYNWSSFTCEPKDKCSFHYNVGDSPTKVCHVNTDDRSLEPQQFHLAFAGKETGTGMAISWTTFGQEKAPAVWIGVSVPTMSQATTATIQTKSYYKDDTYSLYNYHAVVTGLKPNTEYFYRVGSATDPKARSGVGSFKTARAVGDPNPFVVAVYGDMGTDGNAAPVTKYVNTLVGKVDFIYHLGDISYADSDFLSAATFFSFHYEDVWNKFVNSLNSVMRRMAYMVVVGNHEAECHSPVCLQSDSKKDQLGNYSAYNARFRMPSPESGGQLNLWYSFDYASVHFTGLSSESNYPNYPDNAHYTNRKYGGNANQLAWLEADLKAANANRAKVPWIVVSLHRPLYCLEWSDSNGVPNGEAVAVHKAFESLLVKYKVDLVYSGHVHAYERHYPTNNSIAIMDGVSNDGKTYTNPKAPVYVVTGNAGNGEGHSPFPNRPRPKWLASADNAHYGITKLSVTPTKLTVTMVEAATEKVYDEFSILKTTVAST